MIQSQNEQPKRQKYMLDIKNFKIVDQLNSGAFGSVYLIENHQTGDKLAAKVLNFHKDENIYKKMINREIGIMIHCRHPTIIKFLGYSYKDFNDLKNVTIFMELCEKGSLEDFIRRYH